MVRVRTKARVLTRIRTIGGQGAPEDLELLLRCVPQTDEHSRYPEYLLSEGWAVEILTGQQRRHKDIDIIALDEYRPLYALADATKPTDYFTIISMLSEDLQRDHVHSALWQYRNEAIKVYVVSPEFLVASKTCAPQNQELGLGFEPRPKDNEDVGKILQACNLDKSKLVSILTHTNAKYIDQGVALILELNAQYFAKEQPAEEEIVKIHRTLYFGKQN